MQDALKLIIRKSPAAMREAMDTMRAIQASSPMVQHRYNNAVSVALGDYRAEEWTAEDRNLLASYLDEVGGGDTKDATLKIRVTVEEKEHIEALASADGKSLSAWARERLGI